MPIPEAQLDTWLNASRTDTAIRAHEDIRRYLENRDWLRSVHSPLRIFDFDVTLQGSYANYTNVHRDSDVDVLVRLKTPWYYHVSSLSMNEQIRFQHAHPVGEYSFWNFRRDVVEALQAAFGRYAVTLGNKAVRVPGESGVKLDADVLPCVRYRHYYEFNGNDEQGCYEGITFFALPDGRQVTNYPRQHFDNGVAKHQATGGLYKPTVRLFKNARNHLVEHGRLPEGAAPSYFIQGLLYNVPPEVYGGGTRQNFLNVLTWLAGASGRYEPGFYCQNGIIELFGASDEQWEVPEAAGFVLELLQLDAGWR